MIRARPRPVLLHRMVLLLLGVFHDYCEYTWGPWREFVAVYLAPTSNEVRTQGPTKYVVSQ